MTLPLPKPRTPTTAYVQTDHAARTLQRGQDMPVFERKHDRLNHDQRTGLTPPGLLRTTFSRTDRDRRQGTPVTAQLMGDPAPDRLAAAEALRQKLLAKDSRYKIEGSADRIDIRGAYDGRKERSKTPIIERPRGHYIPVAPEDAALEARRGDQVLYFHTNTDAARCLTGGTGDSKAVKTIQNAASGVTASAFGWTWTRLKLQRKRRG